jgi:hypothetical protein
MPAAAHVRTERVDRVLPAVTIIAAPPRERSNAGIWRWTLPVLVSIALVTIGFRSMGSRHPVAHSITVVAQSPPTLVAAPARYETASVGTAGNEQAQAVTAGDAAPAVAPVPASSPASASPTVSDTNAPAPAAAAPPAPAVVANRTLPGKAEPGLESTLSGGAGSIGWTREELAKTYPQMAARFDQIDTDHDGRISPQELADAMQGLGGDRKGALE